MIILDTNIISETMRRRPDQAVLAWLDEQPVSSLFITTVTEAEIRVGIARMAEGKRRDGLTNAADQTFEALFHARVLPFDRDAARDYAEIAAQRLAIGRPISQFDCQIAAIARSRGAAVATRNVVDFAETDLKVINPWQAR